jgi:hypothetical protein
MESFGNAVGGITNDRLVLVKKAFQYITCANNIIIVEVGKVCHTARLHAKSSRQGKEKIRWGLQVVKFLMARFAWLSARAIFSL